MLKVKEIEEFDVTIDLSDGRRVRIIDKYRLLYNAAVAGQLERPIDQWIINHPWGNNVLWVTVYE